MNEPIKLADAMIAWNRHIPGKNPGEISVCEHPDNGKLSHLLCWVHPATRAKDCNLDNEELAAKLMLMIEVWHIALRDGVPLEKIHSALWVIPEYKDMLSDDFHDEFYSCF